jgi:hypothetical protein
MNDVLRTTSAVVRIVTSKSRSVAVLTVLFVLGFVQTTGQF